LGEEGTRRPPAQQESGESWRVKKKGHTGEIQRGREEVALAKVGGEKEIKETIQQNSLSLLRSNYKKRWAEERGDMVIISEDTKGNEEPASRGGQKGCGRPPKIEGLWEGEWGGKRGVKKKKACWKEKGVTVGKGEGATTPKEKKKTSTKLRVRTLRTGDSKRKDIGRARINGLA